VDLRPAVSALWPLSESFEYADELAASLRGLPWLKAPARPRPLRQAENFALLLDLEQAVERSSLEELLAEALAEGPQRWRAELEAAQRAEQRDWSEQPGPSLPPALDGAELALYMPQICSSYRGGYGIERSSIEQALEGAQPEQREAQPATDSDLQLAHDPVYLRGLWALGEQGGGRLTPETEVRAESEAAVRAGVGALLAATRSGLDGQPLSLVLSRPGSHHAARSRAGGTCLVNGLAISAYSALALGAERVAILDLDAHHGNGTEQILWREGRALTASVQQAQPFFPGTGAGSGHGEGPGAGANLNLPVAPGASWRAAALAAVSWLAAAKPDLVLVELSADAHWADPASDLNASDEDYVAVGAALAALGLPLVVEAGSSLSRRAAVGALRSFIRGAARA
jgi:acetoin utilization deacetylase AcuC-like enzyme